MSSLDCTSNVLETLTNSNIDNFLEREINISDIELKLDDK